VTARDIAKKFKLRLGRSGPWIGLGLGYLAYEGIQVASPYFRTLKGLLVVESFVGPALLFWTITFLSPVPWQWSGRSSARPSFWRGAVQSLFLSQLTIGLLVALSWMVYSTSGQRFPWASYLATNLGLYGALMITLGGIQASREAEAEAKMEARSEARAAQTRLLQSQLHPHVLFNALNGLAELIRKDPPRAEHSVKALSDLLRRLLVASEESRVPLSDERTMVEDYLEIEAMRLGDRLQLAWDWDSGLDGTRVIPLLIQPLVENAIKHGVAPHIEGGRLEIRAAREDAGLVLEVRNTGEGLRASDPGRRGIGMKNLASRLALAYGEGARFTLESQGDWVVARIWISMAELRDAEDPHARGAGR
jgi:sensor histidine kinase YesM